MLGNFPNLLLNDLKCSNYYYIKSLLGLYILMLHISGLYLQTSHAMSDSTSKSIYLPFSKFIKLVQILFSEKIKVQINFHHFRMSPPIYHLIYNFSLIMIFQNANREDVFLTITMERNI